MKKIFKSKVFTIIFIICLIFLWIFIEMGGLMGKFADMEEKYRIHIPRGVSLEEKHLPEPSFFGDGIRFYVLKTNSNMENSILDKNEMKEELSQEHIALIRGCNNYFEKEKATKIEINHSLKYKEIKVLDDTLLIIYDETANKYFLIDSRI